MVSTPEFQAISDLHFVPSRTMEFRVTISLRTQAMRATFLDFPAFTSTSYLALKTGLHWMADLAHEDDGAYLRASSPDFADTVVTSTFAVHWRNSGECCGLFVGDVTQLGKAA